MNELKREYLKVKDEIKERIKNFKKKRSEFELFQELVFCILVPQSKMEITDRVVENLGKKIVSFDRNNFLKMLNGIRFAERKAEFVLDSRKFYGKMKQIVHNFKNSFEFRDWLTKNVKGIGMKEASHFIRNIGFDYENPLAILDRHILKRLYELKIINEIPNSLSRKKYLEIEKKFLEFSKKIGIHPYELDMLLWYQKTGKVPKK